jgi:CheY-like chemotaxis protein
MTPPKSVLLVEDEPLSRRLLFHVLREAGYAVEVLSDGVAAIETLKEKSFSTILLDIKLPRMDGISVADHLRKTNPEMLSRTILMTAFPNLLKQVDPTEFFAVLPKPFTADKLLEEVERCSSM